MPIKQTPVFLAVEVSGLHLAAAGFPHLPWQVGFFFVGGVCQTKMVDLGWVLYVLCSWWRFLISQI